MFTRGIPTELLPDLQKVLAVIPTRTYNNVSIGCCETEITYYIGDSQIAVPYRMYFHDINEKVLLDLDNVQKQVLHCIYSRSCNGFVREKHITALLSTQYEGWAIAYIVKLCDEYVVEILTVIYNALKTRNNEEIQRFCWQNGKAMRKSFDRMVSYWNEYYRLDCPHLTDYVGYKLFTECLGYSRAIQRKSFG